MYNNLILSSSCSGECRYEKIKWYRVFIHRGLVSFLSFKDAMQATSCLGMENFLGRGLGGFSVTDRC